MAKAKSEEVLKLWQGLGYYSRALNMHQTAKFITNELGGKFPDNYKDLLALKGIGPYTAAAVASIAFNEKRAVLDGNVFRVLARVYGNDTPIDSSAGKKQFNLLAEEALGNNEPRIHNQAMMELGATICKPKQPVCEECPLRLMCYAYKHDAANLLPVKRNSKSTQNVYLNYVIAMSNGKLAVWKRDRNSIWKDLYEPINIETDKELLKLTKSQIETAFNISLTTAPKLLWQVTHILTHRKIHARFWFVKCKPNSHFEYNIILVSPEELDKLPVHRLFDKFLNSVNLQSLINDVCR